MARRQVTAKDITAPAFGATSGGLLELAWKYARIVGADTIPRFSLRNDLTSKWLGRYAYRPGTPSTIQIQRRVLHDKKTLERVIAHEMCHHAAFLTRPPRGSEEYRFEDPHGPRWLAFADKVNRVMGKDFVTEKSNESYVLSPETKPYYLLITMTAKGRLGFQKTVHYTPMIEVSVRRFSDRQKTVVVESTDPRWAHAPRIGGRSMAVPDNEQDKQDILSLYEGRKR